MIEKTRIQSDSCPTILVVDDVPANLIAIESILSEVDAQLLLAGSGEQALEILMHEKTTPALALLDVQMPIMDGYDLATLLRSQHKTRAMPIIFLSAVFRDTGHIAQGYDAGAVDFLTKPFDSYLLLSKVRIFLEMCRYRQQLVQAERMRSLGQMAAGIAHDFNNLLAAIQGHAELVKVKVAKGIAADKNIQAILQSIARAKDLVSRLQMLHREKDKTDTSFDLVSMLHEVGVLLEASLRSIELHIETEGDSPCIVRGDPGEFQQVLVNLCVNAGHALKDRHDGHIAVTLARQANHVHLSVEDNGCGIPPENLAHIFEPFFTTREVGEGTGLGLSMVHGIVQRMGGTIKCESAVGVGTQFAMRFPVASEAGK